MVKKLQITIDIEHAEKLLYAVEAFGRIGLLQFDQLFDIFNNNKNVDMLKHKDRLFIEAWLRDRLGETECRYDGDTPEEAWLLLDLYQHLRQELSWNCDGLDWRTATRDQITDNIYKGVSHDPPLRR